MRSSWAPSQQRYCAKRIRRTGEWPWPITVLPVHKSARIRRCRQPPPRRPAWRDTPESADSPAPPHRAIRVPSGGRRPSRRSRPFPVPRRRSLRSRGRRCQVSARCRATAGARSQKATCSGDTPRVGSRLDQGRGQRLRRLTDGLETSRRGRETCRPPSCPAGSSSPGNNGRRRLFHPGCRSSWAGGPRQPRSRLICLAEGRLPGARARCRRLAQSCETSRRV